MAPSDRNVIVVTGAGSGIGAEIVAQLSAAGTTICGLGRQSATLERMRETVMQRSNAGTVLIEPCDIGCIDDVTRVFSTLRERQYQVVGLVNNAGIVATRSACTDTDDAAWGKTLQINLTGAFHCARAAIPSMVAAGGGSIVNIASIAGVTALRNRAAYMSSKWGLVGLSQSLAIDYARAGIRSNCVCPGYVRTPLTHDYLEQLPKAELSQLQRAHPLGRFGTPADIAHAVCFLLSDAAAWITGAVLPVDGGYTLGADASGGAVR